MKLIKLEEVIVGSKKLTILVDAETRGTKYASAVWSTK